MGEVRERRAPAQHRSTALATPNYGYEKRQRELAKKRKAEEKKMKKQQPREGGAPEGDAPDGAGPAPDAAAQPGDTPPAG